MNGKIVLVLYYNEWTKGYIGNAYAYVDPSGDLKAGDKVIVPTGVWNERKRAMVVDTDISPDALPAEMMKKLKTVSGKDKAV